MSVWVLGCFEARRGTSLPNVEGERQQGVVVRRSA